jgi:hypothetical protein
MERRTTNTRSLPAEARPPCLSLPYISLRELHKRTDVLARFKGEVSRVIHGDGYGRISPECRRALTRANIGGVTLWEQSR